MEKDEKMGKVWAELEVINAAEEYNAENGTLPNEKVRRIDIKALVDTGATIMVLPETDIKTLGLHVRRITNSRYADGRVREVKIYGPVTVRFQKRTMQCEAMEGGPGMPPLLGQIPMEGLGVLVDPKNQKLILNMESGREDMALIEVYLNF